MTEVGQVYKALIEFKKHMPKVEKSGVNKAFGTGNKYSTLEDVLKVVQGLHEFNLFLDQRNIIDKEVDFPLLITRVVHVDGSSTEASVTPIYMDTKNTPMQRFGSADTYARRYALIKIFGIADIDNDGNELKNTSSDGNSLSPHSQKKKEASSPDSSISGDGDLTLDSELALANDLDSLNKIFKRLDKNEMKNTDIISKFSKRKAELKGATA